MGIDAGDRWVEACIREREEVGRYMYEHQFDYVRRDEYNKLDEKFKKAKDLFSKLLDTIHKKNITLQMHANGTYTDFAEWSEVVEEIEQFLNSEVEK